MALGSWLTLGTRVDADATTRLVARAFDLGITLFDTADVYQDGGAEEALGRAVSGLPQDEIVIATKCFFAMSDRPEARGLSGRHLRESVDGSLRRLGIDRIDLHQCHRFDPDVPLEETIGTYGELISAGKVRHWGVSHWTSSQIREGCAVADRLGTPRPASNQPGYSILDRDIEAEILPTSVQEGLGQLVFSPLAQGALTGKYSGGQIPAASRAGDPKRNRWMGDTLARETLDRIDGLRPFAEELGLSMAQLALAWCLRRPAISSVIVGATRPEQLEENVQATGRTIPPEIDAAIDALFSPPGTTAASEASVR